MTEPEPTHEIHEKQNTKEAPGPPEVPGPPDAPQAQDSGATSGTPQPSRRNRALVVGVVGTVVLTLLVGLTVRLSGGSEDKAASKGDRKPFDKAVASLAVAKGLHYKDTAIAGITVRDVTVTASGKKFGSAGYGDRLKNLAQDVLRIDGKTYTRWKKAHDYEKDSLPKDAQNGPGRCVVNPIGGTATLDEALQQYISPKELAAYLARALDDVDHFPRADDPDSPPLTVHGVPALRADTSVGSLVITRNPPYRALRLEPYDFHDLSKRIREATERGEQPVLPKVTQGPLKEGDSEGMELEPVTSANTEVMFALLEEYIRRLGDAVDESVDFTLKTGGSLNYGASGCSVREGFTGKMTPRENGAHVVVGKVTAVLTATVTINGKPAGRCTSPPTVVRFTGSTSSGNLSCSVPEAGPVYATEHARLKAQAEAQSRASNRPVPYRVSMRAWAEIDARAVALGKVDELTEEVRREKRGA
ncbi:hypothetical protein ABZ826_34010 [Streptomyces sp. NPDC047515]|uniref:hypothetical protein n=1 Tax=Streptomyces sp. NPDC047515 TaxID=3155380 RepID=UPI0033F54B5F